MKKIIWIGPDRLIPPYGAATKDQVLELPDNIADSYVAQKLAVNIKGKPKTSEVKISSSVKTEDR